MPKYKIEGKIYNAATEEEAYAQAYPQNGVSKVSTAPRNRTLSEQVQTLPQD